MLGLFGKRDFTEIQLLNGLIRKVDNMKVEICTKYIADDGTEFHNLNECVSYENKTQKRINEHKETKYIIKDRGKGKTGEIILMSSNLNIPIITKTRAMAKSIKERAYYECIPIPEPIVLDDFLNRGMWKPECLIDNAESIIEESLTKLLNGSKVIALTLTGNE